MTNPPKRTSSIRRGNGSSPVPPKPNPDKTLKDLVDVLDAAYKTYQQSQISQDNINVPANQHSQALVSITILDDRPDIEVWDQWVANAVSNNQIRLTTMSKPAPIGSLLLVAMPYAVWRMMPADDVNFTLIHLFS